MKAILDASVAMKTVLVEPDSAKAEALIADYAAGIHDLLAPEIFAVEVAHGLTRAERRGLITDADQKLSDVMSNAPDLRPYLPLLARAVELSRQARIGVYDCLYVALAEHERCELVTADARLVNAFQGQFPVVLLANMP